ncbi:hypothetical protein Pcinc_030459 [Petrolisthes cinctipes]|uniref:Uncharacterized protein n=1 Tax=Petrolisthes cinctipes TaxID=88211 RepID=A0AAE1K6A6_PETCI|nr:hypothetical protein Pcinc_030459 [Petrolisthes cinctipes]
MMKEGGVSGERGIGCRQEEGRAPEGGSGEAKGWYDSHLPWHSKRQVLGVFKVDGSGGSLGGGCSRGGWCGLEVRQFGEVKVKGQGGPKGGEEEGAGNNLQDPECTDRSS